MQDNPCESYPKQAKKVASKDEAKLTGKPAASEHRINKHVTKLFGSGQSKVRMKGSLYPGVTRGLAKDGPDPMTMLPWLWLVSSLASTRN